MIMPSNLHSQHPEKNEEVDCINLLTKVSDDVKKWMNQNRLKMNDSKTEFIMFGHHSQLKKCKTKSIQISDVKFPKVDIIRYLGAWLDNNLSFKHHVMKKCQVAMWNFLRIRSIRKYLTKKHVKP